MTETLKMREENKNYEASCSPNAVPKYIAPQTKPEKEESIKNMRTRFLTYHRTPTIDSSQLISSAECQSF